MSDEETTTTCDLIVDPNQCTGRCSWYVPPGTRKDGWCSLNTGRALKDIAPLCRQLERQVHPSVLVALKADLLAAGTLRDLEDIGESDLCTELSKSIVAYGFLRQFGRSEGEIRAKIREAQSSWAHRYLPSAFGFHSKDIAEYVRDVDRLFVELDRKYAGEHTADVLAAEALDLISGHGLGAQAQRSLWTYVLGGTFLLSLVALAAWVGTSSSSSSQVPVTDPKANVQPPTPLPIDKPTIPVRPPDIQRATPAPGYDWSRIAAIGGTGLALGVGGVALATRNSNEELIRKIENAGRQAQQFVAQILPRVLTQIRQELNSCHRPVKLIQDLRNRIETLEQEKRDIEEQVETASETIERTLVEKEEMIRNLLARNAQIEDIESLRNQLQENIQSLELARQQSESNRSSFGDQLKDIQQTVQGLESDRSRLIGQLREAEELNRSLTSNRSRLTQELARTEEARQDFKSRFQRRTDQLLRAIGSRDTLKRERANQARQIETVFREKEDLQNQLETAQSNLASANERIENMVLQFASDQQNLELQLRDKQAELDRTVAELQKQIAERTHESEALKREIKRLEDEQAQLVTEADTELNSQSRQIEELESIREENEQLILSLYSKLTELKDKSSARRKEIEQQIQEKEQVRSQLTKALGDLASSRESVKAQGVSLEQAKERQRQLEQQIGLLRDNELRKNKEILDLKRKASSVLTISFQVNGLRKQLEDKDRILQKIKAQKDSLLREHERLKTEYEQFAQLFAVSPATMREFFESYKEIFATHLQSEHSQIDLEDVDTVLERVQQISLSEICQRPPPSNKQE